LYVLCFRIFVGLVHNWFYQMVATPTLQYESYFTFILLQVSKIDLFLIIALFGRVAFAGIVFSITTYVCTPGLYFKCLSYL